MPKIAVARPKTVPPPILVPPILYIPSPILTIETPEPILQSKEGKFEL